MRDVRKLKTAYTHAGVFHADDVFATAFLQMINPDLKVIRTNTPPEKCADDEIVYDIGGGQYDHHDAPDKRKKRKNGVPYAAFGLLWNDYSSVIVKSKAVADRIDRELVENLDYTDNIGFANCLSSSIGVMNPTWDEEGADTDEAFMEAVSFARKILERFIAYRESEIKARDAVLFSRRDGDVLILDKFVPWKETIINEMPDISFIVFPSSRGGYNVQTIPLDMESKEGRIMFPEEWLGKTNEEMGITFCHPGNFLLATGTLEQAIAAAHTAEMMHAAKFASNETVNCTAEIVYVDTDQSEDADHAVELVKLLSVHSDVDRARRKRMYGSIKEVFDEDEEIVRQLNQYCLHDIEPDDSAMEMLIERGILYDDGGIPQVVHDMFFDMSCGLPPY